MIKPRCFISSISLLLLAVALTGRPASANDDAYLTYVGGWGHGTGCKTVDVAVMGDHAFVLNRWSLSVINVADPTSPYEVTSVQLGGNAAKRIRLAGDTAYVIVNTLGLLVFDISDVMNPEHVFTWNGPGLESDLALQGEYLFVAGGKGSPGGPVAIFDISTPNAPLLISTTGTAYSSVTVSGSYAYASRNYNNYAAYFDVLDIGNPESPVILGTYQYVQDRHASRSLAVRGTHVYDGGSQGLYVFDVTDPTAPLPIFHDPALNSSLSDCHGRLLPVSSGAFLMMDLTNPAMPIQVASHAVGGIGGFSDVVGDLHFVADYNDGLFILRNSVPTEDRLSVTVPAGTPEAGYLETPTLMEVEWEYFGDGAVDRWEVGLSLDGGRNVRIVKEDADPFARSLELDIPPVSTAVARVAVRGLSQTGEVLIAAATPWNLILANGNRISIDGLFADGAGYAHEGGVVLVLPPLDPAHDYDVRVSEAGASSCETPFDLVYDLSGDSVAIDMETIRDVPESDLANLPPARYQVTVSHDGSLVPLHSQEILLCRVRDLRPGRPEAEPVLLVHGWMSSAAPWLSGGASPLTAGLIGHDFRPFTFEYPNIDGIAASGAALGEAIAYVLSLGEYESANVIAHSMGGLVTRSYLESVAMVEDGNSLSTYGDYRGDVDRVVTLATPHLGEVGSVLGSVLKTFGCPGAPSGEARFNLDNNEPFIAQLSAAPLPHDVEYLFTAGTGVEGNELKYRIASDILYFGCPWDNDSVVSGCSATGGWVTGYLYESMNIGQAWPRIMDYALGHNEMAEPGRMYDGDPTRSAASSRLLADVLSFLDLGQLSEEYVPGSLPSAGDNAAVSLRITDAGQSVAVLKARSSDLEQQNSSVASKATRDRDEAAVPGVEVVVRDPGHVSRGGGVVYAADAAGLTELHLKPGSYQIELSADGYQPRIEFLAVADSLDNYIWDVALDPVPGGLRHPAVVINNGALATTETTVDLALACLGALEYQLADAPVFDNSPWHSMTPHATWVIEDQEGPQAVYVRYRDSSGTTSTVVSDAIVFQGSATGSLVVTSSPAPAPVYLNGSHTGLITPAVFDDLPAGHHYVTVVADGHRTIPALAAVEIVAGATRTADFMVEELPPPPPVDPLSLGDGDYLSGLPFRWSLPPGWDPAEPLFFDLRISKDADQDSLVFARTAIASTSVDLGHALADSLPYYISLASRDIHGAVQTESPVARRFHLDQTPPEITLLAPVTGDTLDSGGIMSLVTKAADWSGIATFSAIMSANAGQTYSDTLWSGAWEADLEVVVPAHDLANRCLILLDAMDLAGNSAIAVSDSFLVIHDGVTAVPAVEPESCFRLAITGANPLALVSHLAIEVPAGSHARVTVFDLRGRRLRTLLDEAVPAGRVDIAWDGRDTSGQRMAAGVYLLGLESQGRLLVRNIAIVR